MDPHRASKPHDRQASSLNQAADRLLGNLKMGRYIADSQKLGRGLQGFGAGRQRLVGGDIEAGKGALLTIELACVSTHAGRA